MISMKKNGFSFIETVVTVVILSTSLLLVYNSYSSIINNEKQRVYYNDPAYIFRTSAVLQFLNYNSSFIDTIQDEFSISPEYVQQIGINNASMFKNDDQKTLLEQLINSYDINQIFVIKKELLKNCKFNDTDTNSACLNGINELNSAEKFVRTITPRENIDYYLVIEYSELSRFLGIDQGRLAKCFFSTEQKYGCHYYYAVVPINGVYFI